MMESLRALAKRLQTALKQLPAKDTVIQPDGGYLYDLRNGGLILCVCPDKWRNGDTVRVSIPYIIVHNKRIAVPESLFMAEDDGTGEDTLIDFINSQWTDDIAQVQPLKPKRRVKSLHGKFPKLLTDIVCTLDELYAMGLTTDALPDDVADYEMAVWLRKIVGDAVKSVDKYYAFLDRVRRRAEESKFSEMDYDDAIIKLEMNHNKIYNFLESYKLLLSSKEV